MPVGCHAEFQPQSLDIARLLALSCRRKFSTPAPVERWDGKGMPGELGGTQIPLAVRLMQVAQDADMAWQHGLRRLAAIEAARGSMDGGGCPALITSARLARSMGNGR